MPHGRWVTRWNVTWSTSIQARSSRIVSPGSNHVWPAGFPGANAQVANMFTPCTMTIGQPVRLVYHVNLEVNLPDFSVPRYQQVLALISRRYPMKALFFQCLACMPSSGIASYKVTVRAYTPQTTWFATPCGALWETPGKTASSKPIDFYAFS